MPVGTAATVKAMYPDQVQALGADIVLGNTYHLMLRPGAERIAELGGLHKFMNWPYPILTDSGGFQVMSLAKLRKLDENGVTFQSHIDGSRHRADARALDGDPGAARLRHPDAVRRMREAALLATPRRERAMRLSLRWAERSRKAFAQAAGQGDLRHRAGRRRAGACASRARKALADMDFHGLAIGGLAVGEPQDGDAGDDRDGHAASAGRQAALPDGRRHARRSHREPCGAAIDMFDCVMPTRAGRHGLAYTRAGRINLRNAKHADDPRPLDA